MIQLVLVDDHPALRAGLMGVLRAEPGLVPLDAVDSAEQLWPVLARAKPQVVIADYHLPGEDGLSLARRIKRIVPAPAVLIYSAYASGSLLVPAVVAGADGVLHKGVPAPDIYDAVRAVARGEQVMQPISRGLIEEAMGRLETRDMPVLTMRLDGVSPGDIAEALRWTPEAVSASIDRILAALRLDVPTAAAAAP